MSDKPLKEVDRNGLKSRMLSLIGSHFGGVLIAVIVCIGLSGLMLKGSWALLLTQLFVILVYAYPIYGAAWSFGHTDLNRANFGHIRRNRLEGCRLGLFTSIPLLIMGVLFILSKAGLFYNFTAIYRVINAHTWPILNLIQSDWQLKSFTWLQTILFAVVPTAATVLVCGIGYLLGNYDLSPMQKLVYKAKGKDKNGNPKEKKQGSPEVK